MKYLNITSPDVNNGTGCRVTLWLAGCKKHCLGCQNPSTWNFNQGKEVTEETIEELAKILEKPYIKGLTLSGGNPTDNDEGDLVWLLQEIKTRFPEKDIWLYSGDTLETLKGTKLKVLELIDVLVDGEFRLGERDTSLAFRGSRNQRIWKKDDKGEFYV